MAEPPGPAIAILEVFNDIEAHLLDRDEHHLSDPVTGLNLTVATGRSMPDVRHDAHVVQDSEHDAQLFQIATGLQVAALERERRPDPIVTPVLAEERCSRFGRAKVLVYAKRKTERGVILYFRCTPGKTLR